MPTPQPTLAPSVSTVTTDFCEDSTSWYYKKSKNTCSEYVSKKAKNCKKRDELDIRADVACPATCGECEVEETCADSTSWYWKKSKQDCDYVGKDPEERCSLKDDSKVKSKDACPLSCGECEVEESCADSTSWYWKKSKQDCDYVAKKPQDRCSLKDDSKVKSEDACALTCGTC